MPSTTKIIDLISQPSDKPHVSLEYFPPRSAEGAVNLKARMARLETTVHPVFSDITWGAGGSTSDLSLELAQHLSTVCAGPANLHLTCTNTSVANIKVALQQALEAGVTNIVALRGDPPAGEKEWTANKEGFACALDLVSYIRSEFKEAFGISVAGYPEGHPNAISKVEDPASMTESEAARASTNEGVTYTCLDADYEKEMEYLKKKVDAGADFIITQMFFDTAVYVQFVKDCRARGIDCPVVPGLMCISAYGGFTKMTGFCKTRVPADLAKSMQDKKDDPDAVKAFGIEFGTKQCKELVAAGATCLHFYTLNLEKCTLGILEQLELLPQAKEEEELVAA